MPSPKGAQPHTRVTEIVYNSIADWVSKYRDIFSSNNQLGQCTPDEVKRVARDLGVTAKELNVLARKGPDAADLLLKMLVALRIDLKTLEKSEPYVMRDLQRLCTTCGVKNRCEHELANGTAADRFREFCPNAFTLDALLKSRPSGPL